MSRNIEVIHSRIQLKFNILQDLCSYLQDISSIFSRVSHPRDQSIRQLRSSLAKSEFQIEKIHRGYQSISTGVFANYYKSTTHEKSQDFSEKFKKDVIAHMILNNLDTAMSRIETLIKEHSSGEFANFLNTDNSDPALSGLDLATTVPEESVFLGFDFSEFVTDLQNQPRESGSQLFQLNTVDKSTLETQHLRNDQTHDFEIQRAKNTSRSHRETNRNLP